MLIKYYQQSLGKSKDGQSLYEHSFDCVKIAHEIISKYGEGYDQYPQEYIDQLLFSTFIHDVGKLNNSFQQMLISIIAGERPKVTSKHEVNTLEFVDMIQSSEKEIKNHLSERLMYKFTSPININIALSFAVTHHGLYYLSFEGQDLNNVVPKIRRELRVFNDAEIYRITLTDLLFKYHPFGGIVIVADRIASYCHEINRDFEDVFGEVNSLRELIQMLTSRQIEEKIDLIQSREKTFNYEMKYTLKLLLGSLNA